MELKEKISGVPGARTGGLPGHDRDRARGSIRASEPVTLACPGAPPVVLLEHVISFSEAKSLSLCFDYQILDLYISNTIMERKSRANSAKPPNGTPSIEEPSSSSTSTSSAFGGWRLPGLSVLTRTRSTAS